MSSWSWSASCWASCCEFVCRVLLGVLGGVLLAEALPARIVIIVDDGLAAEARPHAAKSAANAERVIMPGEEPANRIGEKHTAGDPCRGAERACQKSASRTAALATPRSGRGARRSIALRGLLPAALRRRRLAPAAARRRRGRAGRRTVRCRRIASRAR